MAERTPTGLGRAFTWVWATTVASSAGDGLVRALLPLLVVASPDHGAGTVGTVMTANFLPWLVLALPVGVLVDRVDRRRVVAAGNLVRAGALLVTALLLNSALNVASLIVLAVVLGTAEVLVDSAAPALLPSVVAPEQLERANARLFVPQIVFTEMLGPASAGLLVSAMALSAVLGGGAAYVVAALFLSAPSLRGVVMRPEPTQTMRSVTSSIREGAAFVARDRELSLILACSGLFAVTYAAMFAMLALLVRDDLGLGPTGYGLIVATASVGAVAGSMIASRVGGGRFNRHLTRVVLPVAGAAYVLVGLSRSVALTVAALFVGGVATMIWNVMVVSLRQRRTPVGIQGRVGSFTRMLSWGMLPLGAALGGWLGEATSVGTVPVVSGIVLLVGSGALAVSLRSHAVD